MNQPIRNRLSKWLRGDLERVASSWGFHECAPLTDAVTVRSALYREKFPDEPPARMEYEAKLDLLAMTIGKKADVMLGWLADFDAAADEVMDTWPGGMTR